jgi:SAM-dependent methyltransferase
MKASDRTGLRACLVAAATVFAACSGSDGGAPNAGTVRFADRDFHRHGDHWYALTAGPGTWEEAEAEARALGGHLVAIGDAAEQAFLERTFMAGEDRRKGAILWIGLSDREHEGAFRWSNGEPLRYVNWNAESREPTDRGPAMGPEGEPVEVGEDYVAANWHWVHTDPTGRYEHPKGTWNDVPLAGSAAPHGSHTDGPYRGIVEIEARPGEPTDLEPGDRDNPYLSRPLAHMDRLFAPYRVADLIAGLDRPEAEIRVLEFGMGVGRVLMELRRRFPEIELHGIGRAPWRPRPRGNERFVRETGVHFRLFTPEEAAAVKLPVLHFHDVDDGDLSFLPSEHFDLIVSQVSFGYVERKDRLLEEFWRVLRPGGVALTDVDELVLVKDGNALALEDFFARVAAEGYEVELRRAAGFPYLRMRKNVDRPLALRLEPRWMEHPVFRDTRSDVRK